MIDEEKYELKFTNRFKKHLKLVEKLNPKNIKKIHEAVNLLQKGELLPERFCNHKLTGNYAGHRDGISNNKMTVLISAYLFFICVQKIIKTIAAHRETANLL